MAVAQTQTLLTLAPGKIFQPSHDQLVVEPQTPKGVTPGGIVIPDKSSMIDARVGKVIRKGAGNRSPTTGELYAMDHNVGDVVVIHPHAMPWEVKEGGKTLLVVRDPEAIGCIVEDPNHLGELRQITLAEFREVWVPKREMPPIDGGPYEVVAPSGDALFDSTSSYPAAALILAKFEQSNPGVGLTGTEQLQQA